MPTFGISWPRPGVRVRIVIVIVLFIGAFCLARHRQVAAAERGR